ncbi:arsenate reductase/protein-tyrosine-phosphatase family protein [Ligilactobacillus sp. LYQ135]
MTNIAFICTQNSCRSQIAEAFSKKYLTNVNCYSAGTNPAPMINVNAVRIMQEKYQINMKKTQYPKKLGELPSIDVVITMGCGVKCPFIPCKKRIEWNIEDPNGKSDSVFIKVIEEIQSKVKNLQFKLS